MFDLDNNKIVSREFYKADFYRCSLTSSAKINNNISNIDTNIPREDR